MCGPGDLPWTFWPAAIVWSVFLVGAAYQFGKQEGEFEEREWWRECENRLR